MKVNDHTAQQIKKDLEKLNETDMVIDGRKVKPCTCYYFDTDPLHVLYNTNCPEMLKNEIERIIKTHIPDAEDSTFKQAES